MSILYRLLCVLGVLSLVLLATWCAKVVLPICGLGESKENVLYYDLVALDHSMEEKICWTVDSYWKTHGRVPTPTELKSLYAHSTIDCDYIDAHYFAFREYDVDFVGFWNFRGAKPTSVSDTWVVLENLRKTKKGMADILELRDGRMHLSADLRYEDRRDDDIRVSGSSVFYKYEPKQ